MNKNHENHTLSEAHKMKLVAEKTNSWLSNIQVTTQIKILKRIQNI